MARHTRRQGLWRARSSVGGSQPPGGAPRAAPAPATPAWAFFIRITSLLVGTEILEHASKKNPFCEI